MTSMSKVYSVLEILILTSTCLVAAYFASLYGREHDEGEGRPLGTLLQPTLIGTAVGAVVLWALFYSLVAKPGEAHPSAHGAAPDARASAGPAHGIADHGSQPPVTAPRAEATHAEGAPQDWSAWLAENVHPAELAAYLIGTLAAAAVGVDDGAIHFGRQRDRDVALAHRGRTENNDELGLHAMFSRKGRKRSHHALEHAFELIAAKFQQHRSAVRTLGGEFNLIKLAQQRTHLVDF